MCEGRLKLVTMIAGLFKGMVNFLPFKFVLPIVLSGVEDK